MMMTPPPMNQMKKAPLVHRHPNTVKITPKSSETKAATMDTPTTPRNPKITISMTPTCLLMKGKHQKTSCHAAAHARENRATNGHMYPKGPHR